MNVFSNLLNFFHLKELLSKNGNTLREIAENARVCTSSFRVKSVGFQSFFRASSILIAGILEFLKSVRFSVTM